jgi:uncharacterized protein YjbI with pentapeptide repeats
MASKKSKRKTLSSLLWETIGEEWGVWLAIAILVFITLLLSNQLATWLEKSAFIKLLDSLSKLGLLVAVIAFLKEIPEWEERAEEEAKRRQFEYWKAIDAARTTERRWDGRLFSGALKIALEGLAKEKDVEGNPIKISTVVANGVHLEGIDLEGAYLHICDFRMSELSKTNFHKTILVDVRFDGARLFGADFREAHFEKEVRFTHALYDEKAEMQFPVGFDLQKVGAYKIAPGVSLKDAMLENASLWDAELAGANLQGANLENAILGGSNLERTNLKNANLKGARGRSMNLNAADLKHANFENTNIEFADLRGATNITIEQIKAARNWEYAIFDDNFRKELGILS